MDGNRQTVVRKTVKTGVTFGSAPAMVIRYTNCTLWAGPSSTGC
jgi:hypothetical protein